MKKLVLVPTIIFIAIVVVLFFIGNAFRIDEIYVGENCFSGNCQCYNIGKCVTCWSNVSITVNSELCPVPDQPCTAQPYQLENNAVVDMLLCACSQAEAINYADADISDGIRDTVNNYFGYNIEPREICNDPGRFMTKMSYG